MTDNQPPPNEDEISARGSRRRIAPTNISTITRNQRPRLSIPYPFRSGIEGDGLDAAEEEEEDQSAERNAATRRREDRDLFQLSHSFFERRSNDEASEELTIPVVEAMPNRRHAHLIPPPVRTDRYFNLVHVPGAFVFDPERQSYAELYELQWSSEHIEPMSEQEMKLKFEQEYPSLLNASLGTMQVPVSEDHSKTFIWVARRDMLTIPGALFPYFGLVACLPSCHYDQR